MSRQVLVGMRDSGLCALLESTWQHSGRRLQTRDPAPHSRAHRQRNSAQIHKGTRLRMQAAVSFVGGESGVPPWELGEAKGGGGGWRMLHAALTAIKATLLTGQPGWIFKPQCWLQRGPTEQGLEHSAFSGN